MRVLHIANAYPYPGVPEYGVFVKEQIDALERSGIECDVFFINARSGGKKAYASAISTLRERPTDRYDVVHCHHLYSLIVAGLARVRPPKVVSYQNDWLNEVAIGIPAARAAVSLAGMRFADRVIFKSPIPARFSGPKFVHLPNGVDENRFHITDRRAARERLGLDPSASYLLFVSSKELHRRQKRYDRFCETLARLRERDPTRDYRELVMVNQPRERVLDFFNGADLHLLCSDFEGSPNSVKEAMCCGLPVVATPVGNVHEMLDGVPGCGVSPSFTVGELAEQVSHCLAQRASPQAVRDGFLAKGLSQEATTARLVALYSEICRS